MSKDVSKKVLKEVPKETAETKGVEKSTDMPSKSAEMASKPKTNKGGKAVAIKKNVKNKNATRSTTSSVSRHSSSPVENATLVAVTIPVTPTKMGKVKLPTKGQKVKA